VRAGARRGRANSRAAAPRLIEENTWRAIRNGLSGELIDLDRGDVLLLPARGSSA
jgi:gamma-glutamyl:cysteine ligase YbdK (ATP-grasp superfamily)